MYFRANCSTRLPLLPVTRPKDPLVGFEFAPPQFGWLRTLYISKRNCRTWRSQVGKFLRIAPSRFQVPGLRNSLRNPGTWNLDGAMRKNFPTWERQVLQFRFEMYNVLNHPNWGGANSNPTSGSFGLVTGKSGNRVLQLALKYIF